MFFLEWLRTFVNEGHWFLGFLIIFFCYNIVLIPFRIINRIIRHLNMRKNGWPPEHLDGDGDHKVKL